MTIEQISVIGWNSYISRTFLFKIKQVKVGSSIQSINVLKVEPIHATVSRNKFQKMDAMFVGVLLRDFARDFAVEFESSRHDEIFESACARYKTVWSPQIFLAPVVQRLDDAIHRINHYPADKC